MLHASCPVACRGARFQLDRKGPPNGDPCSWIFVPQHTFICCARLKCNATGGLQGLLYIELLLWLCFDCAISLFCPNSSVAHLNPGTKRCLYAKCLGGCFYICKAKDHVQNVVLQVVLQCSMFISALNIEKSLCLCAVLILKHSRQLSLVTQPNIHSPWKMESG